jgi:alpha-beta hydrolase superfamily lysophospholipase
MWHARRTLLAPLLASMVLVAGLAAAQAAPATTSTNHSGTTSDGGSWIADVPSSWNGTLLLYSHGFGPPQAADAPDPSTKQALLDRGYALVGSSYDPAGSWWALGSALRDQFEALDAVRTFLPSQPREVIAFGTSMGGLVSALESERGNGRIDGALTTCGLVAGAIHLNNYQLDGEYAMAKLLAAAVPIKLVRFANPDEGLASAKQFDAIAQQAQSTPEGRARLALAMAFMNVPTWAPGQPMPAAYDYAAQEQQQFDIQFSGAFTTMDFIESGRPWIEQAAGGNGSWTVGVDFARQLARSPYAPQVRALYHQAGLDLRSDLGALTAGANIRADAPALRWLAQTSVPSGRLQVPELNLHTTSDQLVPVQQESVYARAVRGAGADRLLRQAYVARQGHCNFTPAELVAGVLAIQHRVESGRWGGVATPWSLQATASGLGLGDAAFVPFRPWPLTGDNGRFPRGQAPW